MGRVVSGLAKVSSVVITASLVGHFIGGFYAIASDSFEACGDELCPSRDATNVAVLAGGFVCLTAAAHYLLKSSLVTPDAKSETPAKIGI